MPVTPHEAERHAAPQAAPSPAPSLAQSPRRTWLAWQLPAGPVWAWVAASLAHLQTATGAHSADNVAMGCGLLRTPDAPENAAPGPGWQTTVLCLDATSADTLAAAGTVGDLARAYAGRCWLLTDGRGRPLARRYPLLDDITGGRGIALALWQRDGVAAPWVCLRRAHVGVAARYGQGQRRLPQAIAQLLQQACWDAAAGVEKTPADAAAAPAPATPARAPAPASIWPVRRLLQGAWRDWATVQRSRWTRELWRIGVIHASLPQLLSSGPWPAVQWIDAPPRRGYWADPMADSASPHHIYCEYFDEASGVGRIERLAVDDAGHVQQRRHVALGGGQHASFPLVVQVAGRHLGLAETAARRECVLHEIDANGNWQPLATVLHGVAAADPALFVWQGRYWVAYTDIDRGETDNLCLQHALSLEGPWQPHANNPVKVDVTGARMAGGFFWHDGALYRPAQNCLSTYGAAVVVQRVLVCTPEQFEEVSVRQLQPDPNGPYPDGMHTLSAWGARTLIDGKRHVFSLRTLGSKLRRRLMGL